MKTHTYEAGYVTLAFESIRFQSPNMLKLF